MDERQYPVICDCPRSMRSIEGHQVFQCYIGRKNIVVKVYLWILGYRVRCSEGHTRLNMNAEVEENMHLMIVYDWTIKSSHSVPKGH